MATLSTDSQDDTYSSTIMNHHQSDPTVITGEYRLSNGITSTITRTYSNFKQLEQAAHSVLKTLEANDCDGNQWILVLGLTKEAIKRLDNDKECLGGVNFRPEWEGTTGLIKVIPGATHESLIDAFNLKPANNKGKGADQGFTPPSRQGAQGQTRGWPTLVIEVGVSESISKLRSDAKFWLNNSSGQSRFVILINTKRARVTFENWMLMPPNAPNPAPPAYVAALRSRPIHSPPLVNQPAASQQLYSAQEVVVTPTGMTGAPMIFPFRALYDRAPGPNETDITITAQDFRAFVQTVF
ncbi:uncharacterized protein NFIA_056050 [Aspergillus fischeri NRRL 181]|uniref:Uncharacterized protein n=1 Tax=Neosartorya fischeri (strain ATCC 1020 / DSM 3700 / CBS 544.65 / FGSC A1164 / JCM 1740 / NRRL 181 / WB 181) TaxID=331117 RepID=A1DN85_NEOFI|nr:uncharacterized protein NFIA_056050 [Aspergillus fischeri NRRL 181]EAW16256.1 hypothetical protein NFIA_056050 [Aspergillus fischeri NRRL 181]